MPTTARRHDPRCPLVLEYHREQPAVSTLKRIYWLKGGSVNTCNVGNLRPALRQATKYKVGIPPMPDDVTVELTANQFSRLLNDPNPSIREFVQMNFAPRLEVRPGHWGREHIRVRLEELANKIDHDVLKEEDDDLFLALSHQRSDIRTIRDGVCMTRKGSIESLAVRLTQCLGWEPEGTRTVIPRILGILTKPERLALHLNATGALQKELDTLEAK